MERYHRYYKERVAVFVLQRLNKKSRWCYYLTINTRLILLANRKGYKYILFPYTIYYNNYYYFMSCDF